MTIAAPTQSYSASRLVFVVQFEPSSMTLGIHPLLFPRSDVAGNQVIFEPDHFLAVEPFKAADCEVSFGDVLEMINERHS